MGGDSRFSDRRFCVATKYLMDTGAYPEFF